MRGRLLDQSGLFSYLLPEKRFRPPIRCERARELVQEVLKELDHGFGKLYSSEGPPSIPRSNS